MDKSKSHVSDLLSVSTKGNGYEFPFDPHYSNTRGNLFGGVQLAAAIDAAEVITGRQSLCASVSFLQTISEGATITCDVSEVVRGYKRSQAIVTGYADDVLAFQVLISLSDTFPSGSEGHRSYVEDLDKAYRTTPESFPVLQGFDAPIIDLLDIRIAAGFFSGVMSPNTQRPGEAKLWMRFKQDIPLEPALLAIFSDWLPLCTESTMKRKVRGRSLDNVLRFINEPVNTRWVLVDAWVDEISDAIGHGGIRLWDENKRLLAVASQSYIPIISDY